MPRTTRKRAVPEYGMLGFREARQDAGPSKCGVDLLRSGGHIDEDLVEPASPLDSPVELIESPVAPSRRPAADTSRTSTAADPRVLPAESASSPEATTAEPTHETMPTKRRSSTKAAPKTRTVSGGTKTSKRVPRSRSGYDLPPVQQYETTSHHFRLPADVNEHLNELAAAHGCTRTHVICAAVATEWKRFKRRKTKATDKTDAPA